MSLFEYQTDPAAIERDSFQQIRTLTDLSRFDADQQQIAMRLVHTSGDPNIVEDLQFSPGAVAAGVQALTRQANILCDVEMVRQGVSGGDLKERAHCFLGNDDVRRRAQEHGETRVMAAMTQWPAYLDGSIVAIGNAPTALFRLLEMLYDGAPRPALIVGMPVGFINAKESKQALLDHAPSQLQIPCITLQGHRGGSGLAAATVNALLRLSKGVRF